MSLYSEAIAAIKSVILIDERVQSVARKLDRLTDEVRDMKDRICSPRVITASAGPAIGSLTRDPYRSAPDNP